MFLKFPLSRGRGTDVELVATCCNVAVCVILFDLHLDLGVGTLYALAVIPPLAMGHPGGSEERRSIACQKVQG